MSKVNVKLEKFKKALVTLEAIYLNPITSDRVNIDATIQRFEFTFELAWKFLKDYFFDQGIVLQYPKEILQHAFMTSLIDNETLWLQMLFDRNMTSHSYDEHIANEIYMRIKDYVPELKKLVQKVS